MAQGTPAFEALIPEQWGRERLYPRRRRFTERRRLGQGYEPVGRLEIGELEPSAGRSEHRGRQMTMVGAGIAQFGSHVGHRTTPAQHLHVDLDWTDGDGCHERGVRRA